MPARRPAPPRAGRVPAAAAATRAAAEVRGEPARALGDGAGRAAAAAGAKTPRAAAEGFRQNETRGTSSGERRALRANDSRIDRGAAAAPRGAARTGGGDFAARRGGAARAAARARADGAEAELRAARARKTPLLPPRWPRRRARARTKTPLLRRRPHREAGGRPSCAKALGRGGRTWRRSPAQPRPTAAPRGTRRRAGAAAPGAPGRRAPPARARAGTRRARAARSSRAPGGLAAAARFQRGARPVGGGGPPLAAQIQLIHAAHPAAAPRSMATAATAPRPPPQPRRSRRLHVPPRAPRVARSGLPAGVARGGRGTRTSLDVREHQPRRAAEEARLRSRAARARATRLRARCSRLARWSSFSTRATARRPPSARGGRALGAGSSRAGRPARGGARAPRRGLARRRGGGARAGGLAAGARPRRGGGARASGAAASASAMAPRHAAPRPRRRRGRARQPSCGPEGARERGARRASQDGEKRGKNGAGGTRRAGRRIARFGGVADQPALVHVECVAAAAGADAAKRAASAATESLAAARSASTSPARFFRPANAPAAPTKVPSVTSGRTPAFHRLRPRRVAKMELKRATTICAPGPARMRRFALARRRFEARRSRAAASAASPVRGGGVDVPLGGGERGAATRSTPNARARRDGQRARARRAPVDTRSAAAEASSRRSPRVARPRKRQSDVFSRLAGGVDDAHLLPEPLGGGVEDQHRGTWCSSRLRTWCGKNFGGMRRSFRAASSARRHSSSASAHASKSAPRARARSCANNGPASSARPLVAGARARDEGGHHERDHVEGGGMAARGRPGRARAPPPAHVGDAARAANRGHCARRARRQRASSPPLELPSSSKSSSKSSPKCSSHQKPAVRGRRAVDGVERGDRERGRVLPPPPPRARVRLRSAPRRGRRRGRRAARASRRPPRSARFWNSVAAAASAVGTACRGVRTSRGAEARVTDAVALDEASARLGPPSRATQALIGRGAPAGTERRAAFFFFVSSRFSTASRALAMDASLMNALHRRLPALGPARGTKSVVADARGVAGRRRGSRWARSSRHPARAPRARAVRGSMPSPRRAASSARRWVQPVPGVPGARHVATRPPASSARLLRVCAQRFLASLATSQTPAWRKASAPHEVDVALEVARHDARDVAKSAATARASSSVSQRQPAPRCDASVVSATNARATSAAASRGRARREGSYAPRARDRRAINRCRDDAVLRLLLGGEAPAFGGGSARARARSASTARNARSRRRQARRRGGERVSASTAGARSGDSAEGDEATPRRVHGAWHGEGGRVVRVITQGASIAAHRRTRRAAGAGPRRRPPPRVAASAEHARRRR